MTNFNALGISKEILFNLRNLGLINPTPIQKEAIIPALEGKDILANAKTGTGKTAAFGIPLIQKLQENKQVTSVILTPTRELALQVEKHLKDLMGNNTKVKSLVIIGGESIQKQIKLIRNKPQLIIGTPGRICDHLNKGTLDLNRVSYLVLDETDRMLDLGFSIQIKKILKFLPKKRQTLLFSATIPNNIEKISQEYLRDPIRISIPDDKLILTNIDHNVVNLSSSEKYDKLLEEIDSRAGGIIVFMKTKHSSKKMCLKLQKYGLSVNAIHGNVRQSKRISILNNFRKKKYRILVATDVAARGLDIPHIKHVINYDLPQNSEDYIHRIGRTARAGSSGAAICFITEKDKKLWKIISKKINPEKSKNNEHQKNEENNSKIKLFRKKGSKTKYLNNKKNSKNKFQSNESSYKEDREIKTEHFKKKRNNNKKTNDRFKFRTKKLKKGLIDSDEHSNENNPKKNKKRNSFLKKGEKKRNLSFKENQSLNDQNNSQKFKNKKKNFKKDTINSKKTFFKKKKLRNNAKKKM
jgi:superfamily II DNA/RNA helicase